MGLLILSRMTTTMTLPCALMPVLTPTREPPSTENPWKDEAFLERAKPPRLVVHLRDSSVSARPGPSDAPARRFCASGMPQTCGHAAMISCVTVPDCCGQLPARQCHQGNRDPTRAAHQHMIATARHLRSPSFNATEDCDYRRALNDP